MSRCFECGQTGGGHFTGCPETPDAEEETPLVCRCCGMDETELKAKFKMERAGPICAGCAPEETKS